MPPTAGTFPEEPPTFETEHAFPQPVEVDRDYGDFQTPDDGFQSALERKQIPGPADGTLGENTEYATPLQFGAGPLDRLRSAVKVRKNRDRLCEPKTPGQQLVVKVGLPHQEPDNGI